MSSCISPFYIKNPNYGTYKDKFGYQYIPVPCGRCEFCLSRKRQQWFFRITQEVAASSSAFFITLTYDDAHLPPDGRVCKSDCQLFFKRFREQIRPHRVRYFLVSEYGGLFGRPHYHLILFNYPAGRDNIIKELQKAWTLCDPLQFERSGVVGTVQAASINYVCKYCLSTIATDDPDKKTFMLCSKGIGKNFLTDAMGDYLRDRLDGLGYVNGRKVPLPRYYADKVFNSQQKMIINRKKAEHHEQDMDQCIKNFDNGNRCGAFRIRQQIKEQQRDKIIKSLKK